MRAFTSTFTATGRESPTACLKPAASDPSLLQLFQTYGGATFENGLYRILDEGGASRWTQILARVMPSESSDVMAFGQDWQGNLFGLRDSAPPCVLLFQIGTGDVFEVADSLDAFHDQELVEHAEEALSLSLWREWESHNRSGLRWRQCVGYRQPLFLGGDNKLSNLEISDAEVYWEILGQLLAQTRDLPEGTRIDEVRLDRLN